MIYTMYVIHIICVLYKYIICYMYHTQLLYVYILYIIVHRHIIYIQIYIYTYIYIYIQFICIYSFNLSYIDELWKTKGTAARYISTLDQPKCKQINMKSYSNCQSQSINAITQLIVICVDSQIWTTLDLIYLTF